MAVGMWSKGAAVGNASRCPRLCPVRCRRIVHMSIALPGAKRQTFAARLFSNANSSGFGEGCRCLPQLPQDQVLCLLCASCFDPALQRPQLRLAGIDVGNDLGKTPQEFLGGRRGFSDEPPFDDGPGICKRIRSGPPPTQLILVLAVGRPDLTALPRSGKAVEERRDPDTCRGRQRGLPRSARRQVAQHLLEPTECRATGAQGRVLRTALGALA